MHKTQHVLCKYNKTQINIVCSVQILSSENNQQDEQQKLFA